VSYVEVDKEAVFLCASAYTSFKINAVTKQKESNIEVGSEEILYRWLRHG
jgi:ribosomal protein L31